MREERAEVVNIGGSIEPGEYEVKIFCARAETHLATWGILG
jgi:hypothetical protein